MLITDAIYKIQKSDKDLEQIQRLNVLLETFVHRRKAISQRMAKGYLDYHGMTPDKFKWRFEAIYNDEGEPVNNEEDPENPTHIKRTSCTYKTAEQTYDMEYETITICKDKVNEYINDIYSRPFDISVNSLPFTNIQYIISNLMRQKFNTGHFKLQLQQAQLDAAIKGSGFLRPVFYDKVAEQKFVKFGKKGGLALADKDNNPYDTAKKVKIQSGLQIERVDPECVFVDPMATNPKEMFIVTPMEVSELAYRFPILKEKKMLREYETLHDIENTEEGNADYINPNWKYNFHAGERLMEVYEINDLSYNNILDYFWDPVANKGDYAFLQPNIGANIVKHTHPAMLGRNGASWFYSDVVGGYLPEQRKAHTYQLVEYYNVVKDTYIVYIDNVILYKGPIIEPFKDLPIVPIYMNNTVEGFYGKPLVENFAPIQRMVTEADHQQRLSNLVNGKEIISIDHAQIDQTYHPNGQLEIGKHNPLTLVHINQNYDAQKAMPAVAPVTLTNGSSVILQNRKNDLMNMLERQFPSMKGLVAGSSPEMQRETMYSRDAMTNAIIGRQAHALSEFAYKVFHLVFFELKYFAPNPGITIPPYIGANTEWQFYIGNTKEDTAKAEIKRAQELEEEYMLALQKKMEEYKQNPQVMQQMEQNFRMQVLQMLPTLPVVQQMFPQGLGNNPQEIAVNTQALLKQPQIAEQLKVFELENKDKFISNILLQQAQQEVQPKQDTNYYLSFEGMENIINLKSVIQFKFDKSQLEKENTMIRLVNMVKPFENIAGFVLDVKEIISEMIIAAGMDPNKIMNSAPIPVPRMFETLNTKIAAQMFINENPLVMADFLNNNLGEQRYSVDTLVAAKQVQEKMLAELKKEEIVLRNTSKAQTNIITDQAKKESDYLIGQENKKMDQQMSLQQMQAEAQMQQPIQAE